MRNKKSFLLRSFRYRNYRLFFFGQGISLIGTWMQNIAMSWLVYSLTKSALMLGLVGFAGQIPSFLFTPFAGVLADRYHRKSILIVTQTLSLIQAFALALLVLTGKISVTHILSLSIFLGLVNALDMPTRQSFVVDMIEKKEDLGNAIALNSSMFNSARLLGPSIAGILISAVGIGACFLINGFSYLMVIGALFAMRGIPKEERERNSHILHELKEGFLYAFDSSLIRWIILVLGLISLVGMPYAVLMPIFAKEILHGGPHTLGFLMGFAGFGALLGAGFLASKENTRGLLRLIPVAASIFGAGLIAFSQSRILWLSYFLMLVTGLGMVMQMASCNTVIQTIVTDDKRGRVMSFYNMSFMGMMPLGSLLAGSLANTLGAPKTLLAGGIVCILGALTFAYKTSLLSEAHKNI
jgi:MFS family permease